MVKNRNLTRWVFVLPAIIIVGLLFVYPFSPAFILALQTNI